jgi:hypothetical protein
MNGSLALPEFRTPIVNASIRSALLDAVDYALLALGEIPRETVYQCIEEKYQIKRDEIPEKFACSMLPFRTCSVGEPNPSSD